MDDDQKTHVKEFKEAVNMTPNELDRWLDTDDSKARLCTKLAELS